MGSSERAEGIIAGGMSENFIAMKTTVTYDARSGDTFDNWTAGTYVALINQFNSSWYKPSCVSCRSSLRLRYHRSRSPEPEWRRDCVRWDRDCVASQGRLEVGSGDESLGKVGKGAENVAHLWRNCGRAKRSI